MILCIIDCKGCRRRLDRFRENAAGYIIGSMALLADGFHMASHAGALGVAPIAYGYARRRVADPLYSFSTGKVGDLAGFASALAPGRA